MSVIRMPFILILQGLMLFSLAGCYHPPFNNFQKDKSMARRVTTVTGVGATIGVAVSSAAGGTLVGAAIGATAGTVYGVYKNSIPVIVEELRNQDIEYVQYGDTNTLLVPTDKYFYFDSARLNEICYPGLFNIVKLLSHYSDSTIYIAGFTDNIGSEKHKKDLSQARAEALLTYLWANNIPAKNLNAEGYADKNPISDNRWIHGSAQNRRVEIQWYKNSLAKAGPVVPGGYVK